MKIYNENNLDQKVRYRRIANTRKSGIVYQYSDKEIIEYAKCYNDIEYFIEKYLGVKIREYQKEWIKAYKENRFLIYTGSRQMGRVTIISALILHSMIFNIEYIIGSIFYKKYTVVEYMNKIKNLYKKIPFFLQPGLKKFDDVISFENGSRIIGMSANPCSLSFGQNVNLLLMVDFAYFTTAETIYNSIIPVMTSLQNSKIIISSSFNGINLFYKMVENGERLEGDPLKNIYKVLKNHWWQVEGRDEEWKKKEISIIGQKAWDEEYDLIFRTKKKYYD